MKDEACILTLFKYLLIASALFLILYFVRQRHEITRPSSENVKAIYISAVQLQKENIIEDTIESLKASEINSLVVDISYTPPNKQNKTNAHEIEKLTALAKINGYYIIARLNIMNSPLIFYYPQWKSKDKKGHSYAWLDPLNEKAKSYILDATEEVARMDFDEVHWDFIRFYHDQKLLDVSQDAKEKAIEEWVVAGKKRVHKYQKTFSAAIFGAALVYKETIVGQTLNSFCHNVDYISPMIYPSLYFQPLSLKLGLNNPSQQPYEVVLKSLLAGKDRLQKCSAKVRPWLQGYSDEKFTFDSFSYQDQIRAAKHSSLTHGWMFWRSSKEDLSVY